MKFCFVAHAHFEANDIEDAFMKLSDHFGAMADGDFESEQTLKFEARSELRIEPYIEEAVH